MSGKPHIRLEEILRGALQIGLDSQKNGRTIEHELESKNGSGHADMDYIIFKGNEDLFWLLRQQRTKLDESRPPCTKEYIDAYDRKASEYGMPEYHRCS
jgi:hypothetical protein